MYACQICMSGMIKWENLIIIVLSGFMKMKDVERRECYTYTVFGITNTIQWFKERLQLFYERK